MQSEKSIQVENLLLRNSNRRSHLEVRRLRVRDHDVQSICRTALKDHYQLLTTRDRRPRRTTHTASLRPAFVAAPSAITARVRTLGLAAVPASAMAPFFRNARRVLLTSSPLSYLR